METANERTHDNDKYNKLERNLIIKKICVCVRAINISFGTTKDLYDVYDEKNVSLLLLC